MASSYILLVASMLNYCYLYGAAAQSVCLRGERLLKFTRVQSDVCVPCENWTFMDEDNHSHTSCKTCTFIEDPEVEVFAKRCNKTHDTVILCSHGFYRRRARNDGEVDMCEECTQCTHPYQACQDYNDTVCCHPSQDTVMTSSGQFVCEERPVVCGPGQFFSTFTKVCLPCPSWDTFMDEDNHSHTACNVCTLIEDPDVEVLISLCNKTHDSVILGKDGFYRRRARSDRQKVRCEECTYCPHPTRACQGYQDTVCCHPNQDAVMISSGMFVCEERPVVCEPGQFFSTSTEDCFPCPGGTFMSAHNHTYKDCLKCEQLSQNKANHAMITRPCSRTAPTLFGCKDGYFRDPTQESLQTEVPCTQCQSCHRRLTNCGMFHDAVCDHKEEVIVSTSSASGVTEDRDTRARGESTPNVTLYSHERNQFQNVTVHQKNNVVVISITCFTWLVIIGITLYQIFWYKESDACPNHPYRKITRRRVVTCVACVILTVALVVCLLLKTVTRQLSDEVTDAVIVLILAAAEIYIAVINLTGCRRPNKPQNNIEIPSDATEYVIVKDHDNKETPRDTKEEVTEKSLDNKETPRDTKEDVTEK